MKASAKSLPVSEKTFLNAILLPLAQAYESDMPLVVRFTLTPVWSTDPVYRFLDSLCALGWLEVSRGCEYRMTSSGYGKFGPRIKKLREQRQQSLRKRLLSQLRGDDS